MKRLNPDLKFPDKVVDTQCMRWISVKGKVIGHRCTNPSFYQSDVWGGFFCKACAKDIIYSQRQCSTSFSKIWIDDTLP